MREPVYDRRYGDISISGYIANDGEKNRAVKTERPRARCARGRWSKGFGVR